MLSTQYKYLWLDPEINGWQLELNPGESYDGFMSIIIKTENMSNSEIDNLIKSVDLTINSKSNFLFYSSKTIYFEK